MRRRRICRATAAHRTSPAPAMNQRDGLQPASRAVIGAGWLTRGCAAPGKGAAAAASIIPVTFGWAGGVGAGSGGGSDELSTSSVVAGAFEPAVTVVPQGAVQP